MEVYVFENIAPTSIASEQAFSIASNFIPKIRSCLNDQSIEDLVSEKGYFAKEDHYWNFFRKIIWKYKHIFYC